MRLTAILTTAAVLCCAFLLGYAGPAAAQNTPQAGTARIYLPVLRGGSGGVQTADQQAMANQVLALVNVERAKAGCGPLSSDPKLTAAAQAHSRDMATNNFFAHSGSGGNDVADRAETAGYSWRALAENIAAGYDTPEEVVKGWMQSDGHRRNILNCSYVHTGVGYVYQSDDAPLAGESWPYYRYWTQVFGTPR